MKKLFMVLAATIICGATTFTSCTNDDNPATPDLDYREAVIGTWEGQTSEGLNVRWQINTDGTYVYARKVGDGGWETMVDEFNEYFADGYLFCARWKNFTAAIRVH